MALPLDGSASVYGASGTSAVTSGNLVSSLTNNKIIVMVEINGAHITSVTGGGVTFAQRAINNPGGFDLEVIEEWEGDSAGVFNDTITVNLNASASFITVQAAAFNGVSGFDVNGSLPVESSSDPVSVDTTASDTIILGLARVGTEFPTEGSGFIKVFGAGYGLLEYKVVAAPQTGLSVTIGTGAGTANGMIGDALEISAAPSTTFIPQMRTQQIGFTPGRN